MKKSETAHLGQIFGFVLSLSLLITFVTYKIFGFEIAILTTLCYSVTLITTAIVGLENTIISKSKSNEII